MTARIVPGVTVLQATNYPESMRSAIINKITEDRIGNYCTF